jgi:hypothetical protein
VSLVLKRVVSSRTAAMIRPRRQPGGRVGGFGLNSLCMHEL